MAKQKLKNDTEKLLGSIINGILDKKGQHIMIMDFTGFSSAICDYFVICHGTSNVQVQTLAESVEQTVKKELEIRVSRREGLQNAEWVLLDYFNVIVHIFQEEKRNFYKLEQLWADAPTVNIDDFIKPVKKATKNVRATKTTTKKTK